MAFSLYISLCVCGEGGVLNFLPGQHFINEEMYVWMCTYVNMYISDIDMYIGMKLVLFCQTEGTQFHLS